VRLAAAVLGLFFLAQQIPPVVQLPPQQTFADWLAELRKDALKRGISEKTLDSALAGIEPIPVVVERDRTQAEIVLTLDQYLKQHLSRKVIQTAQQMARRHADVLGAVAEKYGVPPGVVIAVWGVESNFGRFSGVRPTIATLATLAYDPRRSAMFREELLDALEILDKGDVDPSAMRGSWAGALGQPQFMPSSFLQYAQDFDGDGKRDIWKSTADVFASIANYLAAHGWNRGETWGREVKLPASLKTRLPEVAPLQTTGCLADRQMTTALPMERWRALGVRTVSGGALPRADFQASLVSGVKRHFLVYPNYQALLSYNCVNAYGITVGFLADRATASKGKEAKATKGSKERKKPKRRRGGHR
jgi:peptidoglycan lytic transglycosylase B